MKPQEQYPVNAAKISLSDNLCREDVIDREVTLTMSAAAEGYGAIGLGQAALPGKKPTQAYRLHFAETEKRLVLNATNRKTLQRSFGNDTRNWIGKKITLYFDPEVRCPDGTFGGIRIRAKGEER